MRETSFFKIMRDRIGLKVLSTFICPPRKAELGNNFILTGRTMKMS